MGFSERREALTDVAFATFGDPATWDGKPVTIRPKQGEEDDGFGSIRVVTTSTILRVRKLEITEPKVGDIVVVPGGRLAGRYTVRRGAMLDTKGVWDCPVEATP
jgi:hypothetical protein